MAKVSISVSTDAEVKEIEREVPNAETIAALEEFEEMKTNPAAYKRYPTFKVAMSDAL